MEQNTSFQRRLVDQSSQLDGEMPTNSEGLWGYLQRRLAYGTVTVEKTQLNGIVGELDETYFQRKSQTVGISIVGATGHGHWAPSFSSSLCELKQTFRGLPSFGITPRLLCLLDFGINQLLSLWLSSV